MQKAFHKIQINLLSYCVFSYKITLIIVSESTEAQLERLGINYEYFKRGTS